MQDVSYIEKTHTNPLPENEGSKLGRDKPTRNQPPATPETDT